MKTKGAIRSQQKLDGGIKRPTGRFGSAVRRKNHSRLQSPLLFPMFNLAVGRPRKAGLWLLGWNHATKGLALNVMRSG